MTNYMGPSSSFYFKNMFILFFSFQHQSICEFPSRKFYNNRIVTHEKSTSYVENIPFNTWVSKYNRTVFCQIEGEEEISLGSTEGGNEMSFRNQAEVNQVVSYI